MTKPRLRVSVAVGALVVAALAALTLLESGRSTTQRPPLAFSPALDPGTAIGGVAPDFTLTDQFGRHVSLHSFRGKAVLLAFTDSQCTTICPLSTTAMVDAQRMLGPAGSELALLGVNANPHATSVADVRSYSELHGMTHLWHFTTGSVAALRRVWRAYHIAVEIVRGQIDHTPALFLIGPHGHFRRVYLTQMSYSSIAQQAQLLARAASSLLPGHPRVASRLPYAYIPTIPPTLATSLPLAGGGRAALGPGRARLLLFFATWDSEVTDLGRQLRTLDTYAQAAATSRLPQLLAVDERSVEPSATALTHFLAGLGPLRYPVAIDASGRVADGYGVQDEPWLVLVSASGRPLWYRDVSTLGWLRTPRLIRLVRTALARGRGPAGVAEVGAALAGSPPPLAAVHAQAGRLLGGVQPLMRRIRALRGYPIVLNVWTSWCAPCRAEFGLLAAAAAQFGRHVAFLGADVNDNPGDARAFLAQHPVSYPSYQLAAGQIGAIVPQGLLGTPTTIFITPGGRIAFVHTGQYESQGSLDADVTSYAGG